MFYSVRQMPGKNFPNYNDLIHIHDNNDYIYMIYTELGFDQQKLAVCQTAVLQLKKRFHEDWEWQMKFNVSK